MQILITHGTLARTRVVQVNRFQVAAAALLLLIGLMLASGTIYHFVFLKAAREGWPVVSSIIRLVVRDEFAQRDRFMRENLDVMATRVGEMQAKLVKLEALGDRMSAMVGVKPADLQPMPDDPSARPAKGRCARCDAGGRQAWPGRPVRGATAVRRAAATALAGAARCLRRPARRGRRPPRRPVHLHRVPTAGAAAAGPDGAQLAAGGGERRLRVRLSHRPDHRATGAAYRPGLPRRQRHADPRGRRRRGAARPVACRLRQHARDLARQRPGDALCARLEDPGRGRRHRQAGPACRRHRQHRPLDRAAPAFRGARRRLASGPGEVPRRTGRGGPAGAGRRR